ncbi:hypothetical protein BN59_01649 [Legionella massiliensis]|uniref:Uncharacterized protein n=1 Tax=Legionella massiliensis TaxID=1034943 RepID=A0A078KWK5_9GAMM|nr:hypothetical protein [Legionella massiliensis]CDZ77366.1 hypothetical protein BN59_01649 [Legionella massiliensis]CEE13104.1 hypothetical protein BN1094_01649 [Legionella massiliensis]
MHAVYCYKSYINSDDLGAKALEDVSIIKSKSGYLQFEYLTFPNYSSSTMGRGWGAKITSGTMDIYEIKDESAYRVAQVAIIGNKLDIKPHSNESFYPGTRAPSDKEDLIETVTNLFAPQIKALTELKEPALTAASRGTSKAVFFQPGLTNFRESSDDKHKCQIL